VTVAKKNEAEMPGNTNGFSVANFFQGTKEELEKVVWPSRKQLVSESAGVLLMVTLSASLIYLVDGLFGWVAQQVF
jgi:preprotein translocase subunit SecE